MATAKLVTKEGLQYVVERVKEKAPINSPELTGTPKAPTPADGTDNTQIATTAFVKTAIDNEVQSIYTIKGDVDAYADLPTDAQPGDVYKVNEEYTDGDGNTYPEGTMYVRTEDGKWMPIEQNVNLEAYVKLQYAEETYLKSDDIEVVELSEIIAMFG